MEERSTSTGMPCRVGVAGGRSLEVRHMSVGDLEGVRALYGHLSPEGVYRRFFTASVPPASFFERLVVVEERGGVGLVAVVDGVVVAEIDVEPLANGNGELAIVVDRVWQGWLGPFLVELAAIEAHRRGMQDLEAEILSCNRPMRALTRARGEAFLPSSDWQEVRVVVPTVDHTPGWPMRTSPRVLVEQCSAAFDAVAGLGAAGFDVISCVGRVGRGCPMLAGQRCRLAEGADVVVVVMGPGPDRDELVAEHRRRGTPLAVVEPTGVPIGGDDLVAAVGRGTGGSISSEFDMGADLEDPVGWQAEEP